MLRADKIAAELVVLEKLDRSALAAKWEAVIKRPPPKASSRIFLLRALSYELQLKHLPGLSKAKCKELRTGCKKAGHAPRRKTPPRITLVPGSRLVREWNGQSYTVSVIKEGFVYKDRTWTSLSAIAKDITGAHWSGPRFFGLDKKSA